MLLPWCNRSLGNFLLHVSFLFQFSFFLRPLNWTTGFGSLMSGSFRGELCGSESCMLFSYSFPFCPLPVFILLGPLTGPTASRVPIVKDVLMVFTFLTTADASRSGQWGHMGSNKPDTWWWPQSFMDACSNWWERDTAIESTEHCPLYPHRKNFPRPLNQTA